MWGNKIGWWIAEFLVALVAVVVGAMAYELQISPPTALTKDAPCMKEIHWPIDPSEMVQMDQPGDAGPLYWQAIGAWDEDMYGARETANKDPKTGAYRPLPPLPRTFQLCIDATHMKDATIFGRQPADLDPDIKKIQKSRIKDLSSLNVRTVPELVINYASRRTALLELYGLGTRLKLWGITEIDDSMIDKAHAQQHLDNARTYLEATFALGAKMAKERLAYEELSYGSTLMSESALEMKRVEGDDTPAADQWQKFDNGRMNLMINQIMKAHDIIASQSDAAMVDDVGDVFNLALHSQERVLRIEATLKLGWYRFNTGTHRQISGADYLAHERILNLLTKDPDPYVRNAAWQAKWLTVGIYRDNGVSWEPIY
jgi:hypothetical protein